jgi:hypothetical protein
MLRNDGEFTIYQIEEYQSKWNRWMTISDHEIITVPKDSDERRKYHTACGDAWQQTGIFGFYDIEVAKDYCNKLNEALESGELDKIRWVKEWNETGKVTKYRLVKCYFKQERTPLELKKY